MGKHERWARRDTVHSMGLWQARYQHAVNSNSLGKYKLYFRNYNITINNPSFWQAEGEGTTNHSTTLGEHRISR